MTNKEFQEYLKKFPSNMEIKSFERQSNGSGVIHDISTEFALKWSDTAYYDDDKGKTIWGDGKKYILFNYPLQ